MIGTTKIRPTIAPWSSVTMGQPLRRYLVGACDEVGALLRDYGNEWWASARLGDRRFFVVAHKDASPAMLARGLLEVLHAQP